MASITQASQKTTHTEVPVRWAFSLVTSLFFMFGFITCLNDILVPHLKALFDLNYTQASLVQFTFFGAFFLVSLPAGYIVKKVGYQMGTVYGLIATAIGCALFYPAANAHSYELFLLGLFVLASGVTQIQVAVNPYVSVLGPAKTASVRLNLAQAFNSLGTTLAPLLGAFFILGGAVKSQTEIQALNEADLSAYRAEQASAVQGPYVWLAITLVALALIVYFVRLPKIPTDDGTTNKNDGFMRRIFGDVLHHRHLVLGAAAIFCYVGAEVAIGSYLINFFGLPEILGYPEAKAGNLVAIYWGLAMVGRFIGAAVLEKIKPSKLLAICAGAAGALVLITMLTNGWIAAGAILAVGLFNSIMFPTIFTLAIDGLGEKTPQASGLLCMAIVGGAIIPLAQGALADRMNLHYSFWLPVVCYVFIVYYGAKGFQPRTSQI